MSARGGLLQVDPSTPDDAEDYIDGVLGCRLQDKWILRTLAPAPNVLQVKCDTEAKCVACKVSWPEALLWPGCLQTHSTAEELASLKEVLGEGDILYRAVLVRGRLLSKGTKIFAEADCHVLELSPGPLLFRPPSLCPPCFHAIQRRPLHGAAPPFAVLVRNPPVASQFVPMQTVLARSVDPFMRKNGNMVLEEKEIVMGEGRRAMRLDLPGWQELQRALRLALPGSSIDYLPPPPLSAGFFVSVAPSRGHSNCSMTVQNVAEWLSVAGLCMVVSCVLVLGTAVAELQDLDSWQRALALNGELFQNSIVTVRHEDQGHISFLRPLPALSPLRRRMKVHWLRPISNLPVVARRLVFRFLPAAPVIVPADASSIEDALAMAPERVQLASGTYHLPNGLRLRGPTTELVGDGSVELLLGAPIIVSSQQGGILRNLVIVGTGRLSSNHVDSVRETGSNAHPVVSDDELTAQDALLGTLPHAAGYPCSTATEKRRIDHISSSCISSSRDNQMVRALVCVHSSYVIARGKAYSKYSEMTPEGSQWTFATCSAGNPAIIIQSCCFHGGHHALDVRGSIGLRSRAGSKASRSLGFDLGAWLARCHAGHAEGVGLSPVHLQCSYSKICSRAAYCAQWTAHPMTRVSLLDCELRGAEQEAVHAWRGGQIEMERCWVHNCGQGVTVTRCTDPDLDCHATPNLVRIVDNRFEDISSHAWSSALSIGHLVATVPQEPRNANGSTASPPAGQQLSKYNDLHDGAVVHAPPEMCMSVTFNSNIIRRCSLGIVACDVKLQAQQNTLLDVTLAGWQLCDVRADLQGNTIERCGGTGFCLSSMASVGVVGRLHGNTYRGCNIGIRLTATQRNQLAGACKLEARDETLESNGDGIIVLSPKCSGVFAGCTIRGSRRCGVRIGRGARCCFVSCSMSFNGRGIAVAASSAAEIKNCSFEANVGWAVRLEDAPPTVANATGNGTSWGSVVSGNVFGSVQHGNVGRKRVRIDGWEEGRARIEGNVEDVDCGAVMPLLKRRRNVEAEADEVADRLGEMALDDSDHSVE